jgi:hypothetical protein
MTLTAAYAALGATLTNTPYRTWSHMSDDGQTAIVTLWRHHETPDGMTVDVPAPDHPEGAANQSRIEVLRNALAHRGGRFRAIHLTENPDSPTRKGRIRTAEPDVHRWWRVTWLDQTTGAFHAEVVT